MLPLTLPGYDLLLVSLLDGRKIRFTICFLLIGLLKELAQLNLCLLRLFNSYVYHVRIRSCCQIIALLLRFILFSLSGRVAVAVLLVGVVFIIVVGVLVYVGVSELLVGQVRLVDDEVLAVQLNHCLMVLGGRLPSHVVQTLLVGVVCLLL